jgi:hypothetical protein
MVAAALIGVSKQGTPVTTLLSIQPPAEDKKCPHSRIEFCPLYIAAHEAGGFGCDDGRLGEGGCAVSRGLDYGRALARLSHANRDLVLECAERENRHMKVEQRRRNVKNLGLH